MADNKDKNTSQPKDEQKPDPPPRDAIKSKPENDTRRHIGEMVDNDKNDKNVKRDKR